MKESWQVLRSGPLRIFIAPACLALVGLAGWLGWILAEPHYIHWKGKRAVAQARAFLGRGDLERSGLALQEALRDAPDVAAFQALGDFLEAAGSPQAVQARRRACEARPGDSELALQLAETALRFQDGATARDALDAVEPGKRTQPAYLRAEATAALLSGDRSGAERLLGRIEQSAPDDQTVRLLHASLRLRGPGATRAREQLEAMAREPAQRLPALRALVADAFVRRDRLAAREFGAALAAAPGGSFSDQLDALAAELYADPTSGGAAPLRDAVARRAAADPFAAAHYARWLLVQRGADAAAEWLAGLPPTLAAAPVFAEIRADVAAQWRDWPSLRALVAGGSWGPIPAGAAEDAFAARILQAQGRSELAGRVWSQALKDGGAAAQTGKILARLAGLWEWPDALREALFVAARSAPGDTVVAQRLGGLLRGLGDTHGLLQLAELRRDALPSTRRSADWALLALLVSDPERSGPAARLVADLFARHPEDPFVATDYAFSLWRKGRFAEACAVFDRLPPEERLAPSRAPYAAAFYASAGRREAALAASVRAPRTRDLLPEEADLLKAAR